MSAVFLFCYVAVHQSSVKPASDLGLFVFSGLNSPSLHQSYTEWKLRLDYFLFLFFAGIKN